MARRVALLGVVFVALMVVVGCSGSPAPQPTLAPTAASTEQPPTPVNIQAVTDTPAIPEATAAVSATVPAATAAPAPNAPTTAAPAAGSTAPAPTTAPIKLSPGAFNKVKIFMVAVNDNGKSGPKIGCGDSIVAVDRSITPTSMPLTAAIQELLSIHSQNYGQSGLYNALYQSNLQVSAVALVNGTATIRLTGKFLLGGVCDNPRFRAQINETALQFSTVKRVSVFINNVPMDQLLSGK